MEKDGKTRLYYYHESPYKAKEAWPQPAGWEERNWTYGEKARETYDKADFICVNVSLSRKTGFWFWEKKIRRHFWSVHVPGKDWHAWFEIDRLGNTDEDYANLAEKLEERSGKKGLTILVS